MIDEESKVPLYTQLYERLKADILSGTLKPGAKLKSSRAVSMELHISRNTVELAYGQLFAEGFITSVQRKGYYVETSDMEMFRQCDACNCADTCNCSGDCVCSGVCNCSGVCTCETCNCEKPGEEPAREDITYDFRRGRILPSELPCGQWQRLICRCFQDYREDLAHQESVFGEAGLRTEIQKFIHNYRDVNCTPEQIVVTTGTQFCLDIACQLLKSADKGQAIAMEEPGDDRSRTTFQNNGLRICPMALDRHGADIKSLAAANTAAAYVTPSHQFPTGVVMPASRRKEFAAWAEHRDAFIIEDDCNCHFQHGVRPLPAVQSLCADRVFYIGSFSDLLFPCAGVSYMVVPQTMLDRLHRRLDNHAPFVSFLTQKPLELFMKEGRWESHLRKMRKIHKAKCETLVNALRNRFGSSIYISGFHAGLHLLVQAKWPVKEEELVGRAREAGVGVYPTSRYWSRPDRGRSGTVLLNYGGIAHQDIPDAVERLYEAWHENKHGAIKDVDTGSFALS
ncbi:GntR family transcriptional regulator / MocR family aminotransferase [Sporobacter termitidis DSM 10068]|uniref:GntR family transcriptional regulator / MocR family aminotransferase n=2 Tax=Sporobacter TaxID=44748 RepID=A0A1M5XU38_9FIRM|nr:GntR family transcriptional regulator / MocR family aminotransferase [Sporobacter termitidis DSM 10068]